MFALVRIHVPTTIHDLKTGVARTCVDRVWDYVVENHERWSSGEVRLLYLTRRYLQEDTSLIVDAKSQNALADFLLTHIATIDNVQGVWVLPLTKMRLFEIQKGDTTGFKRFTITISAAPKHLDSIYRRISSLKSGRDIVVNYIAITFQSFKASMMVCVFARSRNHIDYFTDHYIRPIEGVLDTETTFVSKWMRLVSPEDWRSLMGPYSAPSGNEAIENINAEDEDLMSGC